MRTRPITVRPFVLLLLCTLSFLFHLAQSWSWSWSDAPTAAPNAPDPPSHSTNLSPSAQTSSENPAADCTFSFDFPAPGYIATTTEQLVFKYTYSKSCSMASSSGPVVITIKARSAEEDVVYYPDVGDVGDGSAQGSFHLGPLTVGTHFVVAQGSDGKELSSTHVNAFPSEQVRSAARTAAPSSPSLKALRPLSVSKVSADEPARATRKVLVFVGQSSFDGQMVRFLDLAKNLDKQLWSVHFVTLSNERGETVDRIKAALESNGATFSRIELPDVDLSEVKFEYASADLHEKEKFDPAQMPMCGPKELSIDCFKDGLVEFMLSRLEEAQTVPTTVTPAWVRKVYSSMYDVLAPLSPDAVLIASTGYHQDKTISALCKRLPSNPVVAFDLPNPYPVLGLTADFFLSPSVTVSTINGAPEAAVTARPSPVQTYVLPPSVDSSFLAAGSEELLSEETCPKSIHAIKEQLRSKGCDPSSSASPCIIYGMVSRLSPEKSLGVAIESFAQLVHSQHPQDDQQPILIIAGSGHLLQPLQSLASALSVSSRVIFTSHIPHSALPHLLNLFTVFLAPSLLPTETFCIANIEAMSASLPLIGWGIAGPNDYMIDGYNALVPDELNVESLTEAMLVLFDDAEMRTRLGSKGRELVELAYTSERVVEDFEALFLTYIELNKNKNKSSRSEISTTLETPYVTFPSNSLMHVHFKCSALHSSSLKAISQVLCGPKHLSCMQQTLNSLTSTCSSPSWKTQIHEQSLIEDAISLNVNLSPTSVKTLTLYPHDPLLPSVVSFCESNNLGDSDCQMIYDNFSWGSEALYRRTINVLGRNDDNLLVKLW
ncbi:hypothetical protein TrST_g14214 [Triparma strigata]|uniref:Glycosyl transferase family 1 domain-containing protein n=1 Tax=Triparma strigata TaxID=1606541 RepID=A0A9W7BYJ0_9STRA|nr:hypothetical protein TrST_g14214 [Triparma strigata]